MDMDGDGDGGDGDGGDGGDGYWYLANLWSKWVPSAVRNG